MVVSWLFLCIKGRLNVLKDIAVCWLRANILIPPRLNVLGGPLIYSASLFKLASIDAQNRFCAFDLYCKASIRFNCLPT